MIREVRFTPPAQTDVVEAAQDYAKVNESLGAAFIDTAVDLAHSLADSPLRYKEIRSGFRQALLRRFHYLLIYTIEGDVVVVVAVVSGRRDPALIDSLISRR